MTGRSPAPSLVRILSLLTVLSLSLVQMVVQDLFIVILKERLSKLLPCLCKSKDCDKSHDWVRKEQRVCPFFSRGFCRYGNRCRDKHEKLPETEEEPAERGRDTASRGGQGSRSSGRANHQSRSPAPRKRGGSRRRDTARASSNRRSRGSDSSDWRRRDYEMDEAIRAGIEEGIRRMKSRDRGGNRRRSRSKSRPRGEVREVNRGAGGSRKRIDRGSTSQKEEKEDSSSSSSLRPEDLVTAPTSSSAGNERDQENGDQAPGQKKMVQVPKAPRGRGQRQQRRGGAGPGEGGSSNQSAKPQNHVPEKTLEKIRAERTPMTKHLQEVDAARKKAATDKKVKEIMEKIAKREEQKRLNRQQQMEME